MLRAFCAKAAFIFVLFGSMRSFADGNINKVNHIIIVMQENHSYDNYFDVVATRRAVLTITRRIAAQRLITSALPVFPAKWG